MNGSLHIIICLCLFQIRIQVSVKVPHSVLRDLPTSMAIEDCNVIAFEIAELMTIESIFTRIIGRVL